MTWAAARAAMATTIEALTPSTIAYGSVAYSLYHDDADGMVKDRAFVIELDAPPQWMGFVDDTTERWITMAHVTMRFSRSIRSEDDEDRIAEDVQQLQLALKPGSSSGSTWWAIIPQGDSLFSVTMERDDERNFLVHLEMMLHHT